MAKANDFLGSVLDVTKKLTVNDVKPKNQVKSNSPVERVGNGSTVQTKMLGGVHATRQNMKAGDSLFEAIGNAHKKENGELNWTAIAGSTMTAGAALRVASGGGLYRDKNGQTDIIGIPFI